MFSEKIKYTDYDGAEREEVFYFHLSKPELTRMNFSAEGGLQKTVEKIMQEKNGGKLIALFEEIIQMSYGEKSLDGRRFMKDPERTKAFIETPAYEALYMKLATDDNFAAKFIRGIVPPDVANNMTYEPGSDLPIG